MTGKKSKWEGWKGTTEPTLRNASGNHKLDLSIPDSSLTRRQIIQQAACASLLLAFPWAESAFAAVPAIPTISFTPNKTGDGIIGPFGEVIVYNVGGQVMPIKVTAQNGYAVMDFTGRSPFVRIGAAKDTKAITLTGEGVQYGAGTPLKWSATVISAMVKAITSDPNKISGAMQLRSALHTSYPVACKQLQPKYSMGAKMAAVMSKGAVGLGSQIMNPSTSNCTDRTVTTTVTTTITSTIQVIQTVLQQYQACYDAQIAKDPCKSLLFAKGACAAAICAAQAFVDLVTGLITVVTTTVEEVTRLVFVCMAPTVNRWPNPWGPGPSIPGAVPPQKPQTFNILDAINLLKSVCNFFGPWAKCLVEGKWSLPQLNTQLSLGGGNIVVPYGVKVCITSTCAQQLSLQGIGTELTLNWILYLGALAALSPAFAAIAAPFGIIPLAPVAAAAAAAAPAVVAAAAMILAFIILVMWYATAISAQLTFQLFLGAGSDGTVCIEHATFAIALIAVALFAAGGLNLVLICPIVTG